MTMENDIAQVLFTEEQIKTRVAEIGRDILRDFQDKDPVFIGVLKGCFVFMADLLRSMDMLCDMDFMATSSYGSGTTSTGAVRITKDLGRNIEGRNVILVEDILDSGNTLAYLVKYLGMRKPASITICTLFDKPSRRQANISADYAGFLCPDAFIVGYGLDYDQKYRNLPYIGILKPEIYSNR